MNDIFLHLSVYLFKPSFSSKLFPSVLISSHCFLPQSCFDWPVISLRQLPHYLASLSDRLFLLHIWLARTPWLVPEANVFDSALYAQGQDAVVRAPKGHVPPLAQPRHSAAVLMVAWPTYLSIRAANIVLPEYFPNFHFLVASLGLLLADSRLTWLAAKRIPQIAYYGCVFLSAFLSWSLAGAPACLPVSLFASVSVCLTCVCALQKSFWEEWRERCKKDQKGIIWERLKRRSREKYECFSCFSVIEVNKPMSHKPV